MFKRGKKTALFFYLSPVVLVLLFQNCQKAAIQNSEFSSEATASSMPDPSTVQPITEPELMKNLFKNKEVQSALSNVGVVCEFLGQARVPLVTHYPTLNARGVPQIYNPAADDGIRREQDYVLVYNTNIVQLPQVGRYIGQRYSLNSYESSESQVRLNGLLKELCVGDIRQVKFLQETSEVFKAGDLRKMILENVPYFQIIHGVLFKNNLFTVVIPPRWTKSGSSQLPTLFNGFYDLNENFVDLEGSTLFKTLASSYLKKGRTGFGILWNGNGGIGSRTVDAVSYQELNEFLKIYLEDVGASPLKFVTFGGSRGGITALNVASSPNIDAVKVAFAYSTVPPNEISQYEKYVSTTVPALLHASDWSTGFYGSWRNKFVHPSGYGREGFSGLTGTRSHFKVLTSSSDPSFIAENYDAFAPRKAQKLKTNGTQIYLEISSHDFIVPSVDQVKFYNSAKSAGINIEGRLSYLIGHNHDAVARLKKLDQVIGELISSSATNLNFIQKFQMSYYLAQPDGSFVPTVGNQKLLSIELPRVITKDVDTVILGGGAALQKLALVFKKDQSYFYQQLEMNSDGVLVKKINPDLFPEGDSEFFGAYALDANYRPTYRLNLTFTVKGNPVITHFKGSTNPYIHNASSVIVNLIYGPEKSQSYFNSGVSHGSNFGFVSTGQSELSPEDYVALVKAGVPLPSVSLSIQCPTSLMQGSNGTCSATESPAGSLASGYWTLNGIKMENSSTASYTWYNVQPGTFTVQAFAKDKYGRDVQSNKVVVVVRAIPPPPPPAVVLTISCPTNLVAGSNGTCSATESPVGSLASGYWTLNGMKMENSSTLSYTWYNVQPGTYTVQAFGKDIYGRDVQSNKVVVVVRAIPPPPPPAVVLTISCPTNLVAGSNGTCSARESIAGGMASGYWTLNGMKMENSNSFTYTWYNVQPGTYTVQAFGKDIHGRDVQSNAVTVVVR